MNVIFTERELNAIAVLGETCNRVLAEAGRKPETTAKSVEVLKTEKPQVEADLEQVVTDYLHSLGVPAHIKGYQYLREAIMITVEDSEAVSSITKILYPTVAKKYQTTPSRCERAIRHAIEVAWTRGDPEKLDNIFKFTIDPSKGKPTNSEFIALIADLIHMARKQ